MLKKLFGVFVLMFLMSITIPVLAQRYNSCNIRGGRGYSQRYDRGRDYGRNNYSRRDRHVNYGGNYGYYSPAYYAPTYYAPSYYVVRRPARRVYGYNRPYYRPRRNHISFSIGF